MKSIIKKEAKPGLWLADSPIPQINSTEVLIKVHKTSICGTDLHIYKWDDWARKNVPVPLIVGHEFVGEVVEIGKNVNSVKVGDRVSGEGHITCNVCPKCRRGQKHLCLNTRGVGYHVNGCFAEYLKLPAENVFILPDFVSDDIASIFDPFGNAVHTALSFNLTGEDVLITGAGPIGIMAVAIAKKAGARRIVITDINDYRLDMAKKMGATEAINTSRTSLKELTASYDSGFTVGLEMSGHPDAFRSLLENVQQGANVALLGILPPGTAIDWDLVIFKMLTLKGIYGREIFNTWYQMVSLIESGLDLKPIITNEYTPDNFEDAFTVMKTGNCGKIILNWL